MIFLPMLMYSNVNQALKHWMLISNFFLCWKLSGELSDCFILLSPTVPQKKQLDQHRWRVSRLFGEHVALHQWRFIEGELGFLSLTLWLLAQARLPCCVFQRFLTSSSLPGRAKPFCHGSPFSPTNLSTLFTSITSILFIWNSSCFHLPQIFSIHFFLSPTSVASRPLCQSWFLFP